VRGTAIARGRACRLATDYRLRTRASGFGRPPRCRIHRKVKLTDALIAATAVEHGLPVVTQDDDYRQMSRAHGPLQVITV
jgi:predicted nucleic acid-binding protein